MKLCGIYKFLAIARQGVNNDASTKTFLNNLNDAVVHLLTLKDTKWTHYMIKLKINCNPPVIYFPKNA